jgi:hypothetical protein
MTAGTVAVIGEQPQVRGYALAGAVVLAADGADAVHRAWASLDDQTILVILTKNAALCPWSARPWRHSGMMLDTPARVTPCTAARRVAAPGRRRGGSNPGRRQFRNSRCARPRRK